MTQELFDIVNLEAQEGQLLAEVTLNPSHRIFEGHFPGAPVTPGVIQLEMVKAALKEHFQTEIKAHSIRTCKFLEILDPRQTPELSIHIKYKGADPLEVIASGQAGDKIFFKVQATYQK